MRFRFLIFAFLLGFLCAKACGQGLTLRDVTFVGSIGTGGGGGGGTTGGGGTSPGVPTDFFTMDESDDTDRASSVPGSSAAFHSSPGSFSSTTGLHGSATVASGSLYGYADTDDQYVQTDPCSWNYWMKLGTVTDTSKPTFAFQAGPGLGDSIYVSVENSINFLTGLTLHISESGVGSETAEDSSYTPDSNWVMLTVVWNPGTVTLYRDGSQVAQISTAKIVRTAFPEFAFNSSSGDDATFDDVAIWLNHALTEDEITWLYNSGAGRQYSDF